jgi:nitroreductase
MRSLAFDDKPGKFPATQVKGGALKPLTQVLLDRRATAHFLPDPVPAEYLEAILRFAAQAPSGYNFQPWRFVVVREAENKKRLQKAAHNQPKVAEAPVMVVVFAVNDEWRASIDQILQEGVRRGIGNAETAGKTKQNALQFLESLPPALWMNRHTMIAMTTLMLVAESYGLDTAPMEGFDPAAVRQVLGLPDNAEVVAMLAIGFAREPDKAYGGRLALSETVFSEKYGEPWKPTS